MARFGEWARQEVDLEHWAAFQRTFQAVADLVTEVADGRRGDAPQTVTFLGGDVHHSYVSEVKRRRGSRVVQAVCSPIRNPLPRFFRFLTAAAGLRRRRADGARGGPLRTCPCAALPWRRLAGPWFDNAIATLEDHDDGLLLRWDKGVVGDDPQESRLELVEERLIARRH